MLHTQQQETGIKYTLDNICRLIGLLLAISQSHVGNIYLPEITAFLTCFPVALIAILGAYGVVVVIGKDRRLTRPTLCLEELRKQTIWRPQKFLWRGIFTDLQIKSEILFKKDFVSIFYEI